MLLTLIEKEWKSVLLSPKFALTFAVTAVLILLSIGIGIREYRAFEAQQAAAQRLLAAEHLEETSWTGLATRVFRAGDPLQIFAGGVHNDVGRLARISPRADARLDQSIYSDDTILAVFRAFDLSLVVQAVLSLFAILFTYDAINGERQAGTLRLIFAGAVPRARFVLAKCLGTWLALALPLALPLLLGLLAVVLARVPLSAEHWQRLGLLLLASGLYLTLFMAFGIAVSALTRKPATSFLVLLVSWIILVLVVPRVGLYAAVRRVPVPTEAELESQRSGFENRAWNDHRESLTQRWSERQAAMAGLSDEQQEAYEDDNLWRWLEEDDAARKAVEAEIAAHAERLYENLRNAKAEQERLALDFSRLSPASAYRLVAMHVAGTGVSLKPRYEAAARDYKEAFTSFLSANSGAGGSRIHRRRGGHSGNLLGAQEPLDLSGMPVFQAPAAVGETLARVPLDLGLLAIETLLCFAAGFVGFLRYDVR